MLLPSFLLLELLACRSILTVALTVHQDSVLFPRYLAVAVTKVITKILRKNLINKF